MSTSSNLGSEALLRSPDNGSLENFFPDSTLRGANSQRARRSKHRLLLGSYVVLFTRYYIATFLSSFFPQVATHLCISDDNQGLIFSMYPIGMAITSVFAPTMISCIGTRLATLLGLGATVLFTTIFGLAPHFASMPNLQYVLMASYFFNGMLGALAETACIIVVNHKFKENPGAVMAGVNNASTIGCMIGPFIGGALYSAGKHIVIPGQAHYDSTNKMAFGLPCYVSAGIALIMLLLTPLFMPQLHIGADGSAKTADGSSSGNGNGGPGSSSSTSSGSLVPNAATSTNGGKPVARPSRWVLFSPSIILGLFSIALSGCLVGTLDPTLAIRLSASPFHFDANWVGMSFFFSSLSYVIVATPTGWLVDKRPASPRLYKLITAAGFLVLFVTFGLLAPFGTAAFGTTPAVAREPVDHLQKALNTLPIAMFALVLKGVGSALSNAAIYPDLVHKVPDDDYLQSTLSAFWNAAYAIGWATGPYLGDALKYGYTQNALCVDKYALPPFCPADHPTPAHLPPPPSLHMPPPPPSPMPSPPLPADCWAPAVSNCSCTWMPDNGFDGFASTVSLISLAYVVPLLLAVLFNVNGPNTRCGVHRPSANGGAAGEIGGVAPLYAAKPAASP